MSNRHRGNDLGRRLADAGSRLLATLGDLIAEGTWRRVLIRKRDGNRLGEVSLTVAVLVSGLLVLLIPTLVAIAALGALVAGVRVEIVHDGFDD